MDAINSRDFDALDRMPFAPDFEFRSVIAISEGDVYVGMDGLRRWAAAVDETWSDFRADPVEFREAPGDRAVVVFHATGRAQASGVPLDVRNAQVWMWRDGRLCRVDAYSNPRDAFHAVGLSEEAMPPENVRVVEDHVQAFRSGDPEDALSSLDPHVVFDISRYAAEGEPIVGPSAMDRFASQFKGAFEHYDYEMTEFRDLGGGTVLAVGREHGQGKASGVAVDRPLAALYNVIDGKIVRVTMFGTAAEALAAVGLSE